MIKLDLTAVHFELDDKLKSYINRKIGKLDRYVPKGARQSSHGKVVLTEDSGAAKNRFTCEVTLTMPHGQISAKEATINIYAAADIVEAKLKAQLGKHKTRLTDHRPHKRVLGRLRRINPFQK